MQASRMEKACFRRTGRLQMYRARSAKRDDSRAYGLMRMNIDSLGGLQR